MGFVKEFKEFTLRGNVVDLAIGIIIGGAFSNIVTSLINDIITPAILNPLFSVMKVNELQDLKIPGTAIKFGSFLSALIGFVTTAFALFLIIKGMNATRKKEVAAPVAPPAPSKEETLLSEIRDILKQKN